MAILVLDSGVGGLTVLREVRAILPTEQIIYVGDDDGFPYGSWPEDALVERLVDLFAHYLNTHTIELAIVACNTASTLIMPSLREAFDIPFVGTVPAIKPATERTVSGLVSVLATPGTVNRSYTQSLIEKFAGDVAVNLVGSNNLAQLAEHYMQHREIDTQLLQREMAPCFVEQNAKRTDIVVIDPSEAVAQRAFDVFERRTIIQSPSNVLLPDLAYLTSNESNSAAQRLLQGFGLHLQQHSPVELGSTYQP